MTDSRQINNKKRIRIIIITTVAFLGIALIALAMLFLTKPKADPDITAEKIGRIGDHVYYPEKLFLVEYSSEEQKEEIKSYLESLDATLDEDVYITLCMYYPSTDGSMFRHPHMSTVL